MESLYSVLMFKFNKKLTHVTGWSRVTNVHEDASIEYNRLCTFLSPVILITAP